MMLSLHKTIHLEVILCVDCYINHTKLHNKSMLKGKYSKGIIAQNKNKILKTLWEDPYLHALVSDGLFNNIMIDKNTDHISTNNPKDREYFIVVETTISKHQRRVGQNLKEQLEHIAKKYFIVTGTNLDDQVDENTLWITVNITFP